MTKSEHSATFDFAGFFVLRTPLFPFERAISLFAETTRQDEGPLSVPDALAGFTDDAIFCEAIALASPTLHDRLRQAGRLERGRAHDRIQQSLLRYALRAAARCTPYGLFARTTVGRRGPHSQFNITMPAAGKAYARLDHEPIGALVDQFVADRELRRLLSYERNTSLYRLGGQWRYVERVTGAKGWGRFHITAADTSTDLESILALASTRTEYRALVATLNAAGVSEIDAEAFIDELIDAQVLVATIEPSPTGGDALDHITRELRLASPNHPSLEKLVRLTESLHLAGSAQIGTALRTYERIADQVRELSLGRPFGNVLDVQLSGSSSGIALGESFYSELRTAFQLLESCRDPLADTVIHRAAAELAQFQSAFLARYEYQSVKLAHVLDNELGIGFRGAWNQPHRERHSDNQPSARAWSPRDSVLSAFQARALRSRSRNIDLTEEDIVSLAATVPPLTIRRPYSFTAMTKIAAENAQAIDDGNFLLHISSCGGPHSTAMMGRFCATDSRLADLVRLELEQNARRDFACVTAEIAHLPEWRMANVILRPRLQDYEIGYLGRPSAGADHRIELDDLYVCTRDGEVVLWSERLACEIVPQLTSAHAAFDDVNVPTYRFLYALQLQRHALNPSWSWGALAKSVFLPRLTYRKIVISLARWWVPKREFQGLEELSLDLVAAWRERLGLPTLVTFTQGDHTLPLDLETTLGIRTLIDLAGDYDDILLVEVFPPPDCLVVSDGMSRYTHELLIPTRRLASPNTVSTESRQYSPVESAPSFTLGSEWLYTKLYTGRVTAERLLVEAVGPLLAGMQAEGAIDTWFFLRYSDPHFHIRLRLHGSARRLANDVLPRLGETMRPYLENGALVDLVVDVYQPELDRYGGPEASLSAHGAFLADSVCALKSLSAFSGAPQLDRDLLVMLAIDRLLDDARMPAEERASFFADAVEIARVRADSSSASRAARSVVADEYRAMRGAIERVLERPRLSESSWTAADALFEERSRTTRGVFETLRGMERDARLSRPFRSVLRSLVHMTVNRMMAPSYADREHEYYFFLRQYYRSRLARERHVGGNGEKTTEMRVT
jgi:thiopeptide-type bacteriocin biosynthesis protein